MAREGPPRPVAIGPRVPPHARADRSLDERHRSFVQRSIAALVVVLALAVVGGAQESGFDTSRYAPRPIGALLRELPTTGTGLTISQDVPIRSRVSYTGEFRDLPEDSRRLVAAWAASMNVAGMPEAFRREVRVREAGIEYWLPVQEALVPLMRAELRDGEPIEIFVIYIGQVNGRHVLLVNAFDHEGGHGSRR